MHKLGQTISHELLCNLVFFFSSKAKSAITRIWNCYPLVSVFDDGTTNHTGTYDGHRIDMSQEIDKCVDIGRYPALCQEGYAD